MKNKIAIFAESSKYGGISTYCVNLAYGLQLQGYDVVIICPIEDRVPNRWVIEQCVELNIKHKTFVFDKAFDLKVVKAINTYIREEGISILHTNGYRLNTIVKLCQLLSFKWRKHIMTIHGILPKGFLKNNKAKSFYRFNDLSAFMGSQIIAVSNFTKNSYSKQALICPKKIHTVYNAIRYDEIAPSIKSKELIQVSFVGRLEREKGIDFFCDIVSAFIDKYPLLNVRFNIYGTGKFEDDVNALQAKYPLKVIYHGFKAQASDMLLDADILIVPSVVETFGLVVLEAAQYGVVSIASKVGGLPEIIENNTNGILINYGDVFGFVESIYRLSTDKEQLSRLSLNTKLMTHRFTIKNMTKQTLEIYNK